jgi:hypothetical protein
VSDNKYEYKGRLYTLKEIEAMPECHTCYHTLYRRINTSGWTVEKAMEEKRDHNKKEVFRKFEKGEKERLIEIMKKPIKPTSSYDHWVHKERYK